MSDEIRKMAVRCWQWGANVTAIKSTGKNPYKNTAHRWKPYHSRRQTKEEIEGLGWDRKDLSGCGVICGCAAWRCIDIDDCKAFWPVERILDALGLPHSYKWVIRSGSGKGWHIWLRCRGALPPDFLQVKKGESGVRTGLPKKTDAFDHLEVRWKRCQTLLPPSEHESGGQYEFFNGTPEKPPLEVPVQRVVKAICTVAHAPEVSAKKNTKKNTRRNRQAEAAAATEGLALQAIGKAVDRARATHERNEAGFWLACQLRDNGFSEKEALRLGRRYVKMVAKDKPDDEYTFDEYEASVEQAFHNGNPREPWSSNGRHAKTESSAAEEIGILASDVEPETVPWSWKGRLARGEMTMFDGDPDLGKSTVLCDVSARITTGRPMPGDEGLVPTKPEAAGGVVIVTGEDSIAHTIRPRLEAAGADLERCLIVQTVPDANGNPRPAVIPNDLNRLHRAVKSVEARLLIIDPLMAHLSPELNAHRDQDVRAALTPLAGFAREAGCAVAVVRHLNKSPGLSALYRGGGSIGIIGAFRIGFLLGRDPQDEERVVLAPTKNNLAPKPPSLRLRLEGSPDVEGVARVRWEGPCDLSAQDLLRRPDRRGRPPEAEAEAMAFLKEVLGDGEPRRSAEIHELRKKRGIAERTFKRAKERLGVESERLEPGSGPWYMVPPWNPPEEDQKAECQKSPGQNDSGTLHNTRAKRIKPPAQAENGVFQEADSSGEGQSAKKETSGTLEKKSASVPGFQNHQHVETPKGRGRVVKVEGRIVYVELDNARIDKTEAFDFEDVEPLEAPF